MRSLLLLVDSRSYIRSNCYQHQLLATLEKNFRVRMLSLREIRYLPLVDVSRFDVILSVLKLRTLVASLNSVASFLRGKRTFIYEQDPWEAFADGARCRGAYEEIADKINVGSFLVTSQWWGDYIRARGFSVRFVRMGMLPELCSAGPEWEARKIRIGFQGTLHPHRRLFFERLVGAGVTVSILPSASYAGYLENLHDMRIYIHTENAPWKIDGKDVPRNALWIKETEIAARGTFAIRDYEDESLAYNIAELPTIMTFRDVNEVPDIIAQIESMDAKERRDRMIESAATMRRRDDWMSVVQSIEQ